MKRILIANRGEIACRIIRAAHALGHQAIAVYSDADDGAMHVRLADRAVRIGPPPATLSYLSQDAILAAATEAEADAVHPGYGFLAENASFARAVIDAGLAWIGPAPESIEEMGDKEHARALAKENGVPVLDGSRRFAEGDLDGLEAAALAVGYPLLVKAAAGGGGIGMRLVEGPDQLAKVVETTQSLAKRSFGDGSVYLERYIARARHVEIQVFGFGNGDACHFHERDCSTQRRFQKVIEESPSPGLDPAVGTRMAKIACEFAASRNYRGAGTVEFIVDAESQDFFFLEMNTRIQVEHPVTELVCGVDLVEMQIQLAMGNVPKVDQASIVLDGAAIECRLYAENPAKMFLPSPGTLSAFELLEGRDGVRIDTGVRTGDVITPYYDPMIAKIVAWGPTRDEAITRAISALRAIRIEGIATNRDFLIAVLDHPEFRAGNVWTGFIDQHRSALIPKPSAA